MYRATDCKGGAQLGVHQARRSRHRSVWRVGLANSMLAGAMFTGGIVSYAQEPGGALTGVANGVRSAGPVTGGPFGNPPSGPPDGSCVAVGSRMTAGVRPEWNLASKPLSPDGVSHLPGVHAARSYRAE